MYNLKNKDTQKKFKEYTDLKPDLKPIWHKYSKVISILTY